MSHAPAPVELHVACGSDEEAATIATALVEQRLAACVQVLPIRSTYRWDGAVHRDDEVLLVVKTTAARTTELASAIAALHSYELPAITWVPVAATAATAAWLVDQTAP